jgi:hydrogenase maturation protease
VYQLLNTLSESALGGAFMKLPIIAGLGSHHGDDCAGWLVLDRLQERSYPQSLLRRLMHPADLLDVVTAENSLVVCDACTGLAGAGSIHRFRWPSEALSYQRGAGSHDLPLLHVMELGQRLGCLPDTVEIWVLEGETWTGGAKPSDAMRSAAVRVADHLWEETSQA